MSIERLRGLVFEDFESVNHLILNKIQSEVSLIDDLASHIVQSGGKRLRPLLVLLSCHACSYKGDEHIKLAAMIEFFHTATLLHDDVVDESTLRRGRETANEIWGSKASILVGDYLFIQYMQLMIEVGNMDIMKLLMGISHRISCGEIKQLNNRHIPTLEIGEYFDVIEAKTSILFAASSALGPMIAASGEDVFQGLYDYGLHLGNAFQLIDDALDYSSDSETLGKNIGDDLSDGKATLPLLHALKNSQPHEQHLIKDSLEKGNIEALPDILEIIQKTESIEYTQLIAQQEAEKAIASLEVVSDSIFKNALIELAQYSVTREF